VLDRFREQFDALTAEGYLAEATADIVQLTREGLLRVDVLLRRFFHPQYVDVRYT
jgi:oxygen-independent coproporphyrinogen-3 oxidase